MKDFKCFAATFLRAMVCIRVMGDAAGRHMAMQIFYVCAQKPVRQLTPSQHQ